jgi:FMN phosphatase YigB (HAD superfamily)
MEKKGCVLFDWGDTLMRVLPQFHGPMKDWPQVEAVTGAAALLEALHPQWTLALATNAADSDEADIQAALRRVGLDSWLDKIFCFKNVGFQKPYPEFFQFILEDLNLPVDKAIMVGDNVETDVQGALANGLKAIWFNEISTEEIKLDGCWTVHALREVVDILENYKNGRP